MTREDLDSLKRVVKHHETKYGSAPSIIVWLLNDIESLRNALEFYADYEEWVDYKEVDSHFDGDLGARARKALGEG